MSQAAHPLVNGLAPAALGSQLRDARTQNKISLRELARRVGVSASFLSQVELGRAKPSIGTLYSIVSELGLSLDSLMNEEDRQPSPSEHTVERTRLRGRIPGLQRAEDRPEISMSGVRWERLTEQDDPLVEFLRVTYTAGSESCRPDSMMRHPGWEYLHILSGRLDVQVGFNGETMEPGDSLNFDSNTPHRLSNPYDEDCVALWVVVGRQGFAHPMDLAGRNTVQDSSTVTELAVQGHFSSSAPASAPDAHG
ncbi:helix-turn-helix domain-containing protein [uncultured Kocuria sp.]|uniref:helix-turn-helix domain-containing protein n=1 Tax=uncultured Kocuria sp. TaxID=259305 RepID=UPI002631D812|nr:XRE family transcriptional regulator [uncultured Kocuria sp.]